MSEDLFLVRAPHRKFLREQNIPPLGISVARSKSLEHNFTRIWAVPRISSLSLTTRRSVRRGSNISGTSTSRRVLIAVPTGRSGTCRSGWSRESTRTTRSTWDQSPEGRKVYEKRRHLHRMLGREYARERLKVGGIMLGRWRSSISCSVSSGLLSASRCGSRCR